MGPGALAGGPGSRARDRRFHGQFRSAANAGAAEKSVVKKRGVAPSWSERRFSHRALFQLIVCFVAHFFGHFKPMFRQPKPVLFVERSNRYLGLLLTFSSLPTVLTGPAD